MKMKRSNVALRDQMIAAIYTLQEARPAGTLEEYLPIFKEIWWVVEKLRGMDYTLDEIFARYNKDLEIIDDAS